jgi:hypothetical protein
MLRSVMPQFSEMGALKRTSFLTNTNKHWQDNQIAITFGRRSAGASRAG